MRVLVTGGARRIGAAIARHLAAAGHRVAVHHHDSHDEAEALAAELGVALVTADLADPAPLTALYEPVGVSVVVTRQDGHAIEGLDELRGAIAGKVSVLVGHSGVGKSTLVNALVPSAERATGDVNDVTGRGRHTSTSAVALRVPSPDASSGSSSGGGPGAGPATWVIDTPGVRSFGLAHVKVEHLLAAFADLAEVAAECPRGCTHAADAPDCELDVWVAAGTDESTREARAARVDSFRRLLAARSGAPEPDEQASH